MYIECPYCRYLNDTTEDRVCYGCKKPVVFHEEEPEEPKKQLEEEPHVWPHE